MRIDQFIPSLVRHDAISNHAFQARRALRAAGFESDIFYEAVDHRLAKEARPFQSCNPKANAERLILYHASTASPMARWVQEAAGSGQRVASDYHNITPSRYFARWEPSAAKSMALARRQLADLASATSLALADSVFNEAELRELGYSPTTVCPLLVDFAEYHGRPDQRLLSELRRQRDEGGTRWLFVGRIAPNKCQHDVLAAFAIYHRLFNPRARLTFVGGATAPRYLRALQEMAVDLALGDHVEFSDSTPFDQLLAYYRGSDVFVCLSEHEGFCVPLIEAMELELPVVAYAAAAVGDTVGDGGLVLKDKDPLEVACAVDRLLSDPSGLDEARARGRARAGAFSLERTSATFVGAIEQWLTAT